MSDIKRLIKDHLQLSVATYDDLCKKLSCSKATIRKYLKEIEEEGIEIKKERLGNDRTLSFTLKTELDEIVEMSKDYIPPKSTYDNPVEIPLKDPNHPKINFTNTIYAGGKADERVIKNNLRHAEANGLDAVVITGNLVWTDLFGFTKYTSDRVQTLDDKAMDYSMVEYPKAVVDSGRDPKKLAAEGKPVYVTFKERLDMVIQHSLKNLFHDEEGNPIYNGNIYMIFGAMEEELTRAHVNQTVKLNLNKEKAIVRAHKSHLRTELRSMEKEIKALKKELDGLDEEDELNPKNIEYELEHEEEQRQTILEKIADWDLYQSRLVMRNNDQISIKETLKAMQGYIINKLESAIPNSKFVSTGEAFLRVDDEMYQIMPNGNKVSTAPSDNAMTPLKNKIDEELHQGEKVGDLVVGGGLSTTYTKLYSHKETIDGTKTIPVYQLPTCLDAKTLKDLLRQKVKTGSQQEKLITKGNFNSGSLVIETFKDPVTKAKIRKEYELRHEFLSNDNVFENIKKISQPEIFYQCQVSDQHWGSNRMSLIETEDNWVPTWVLFQQLLMDMNAPLVRLQLLGDELQEKNYATETEGHPEHKKPITMKRLRKRIMESNLSIEEKLKEINKTAELNDYRSGILMPGEQLTDFMNHLNYNLIKKILQNHEDVGFYGPAILCINGNHNEHTADGMYTTSKMIIREMLIRLGVTEDEISLKEGLASKILGSMDGKLGIYDGLFGIAPGKQNMELREALEQKENYLYAEYMRHKVKSGKTGDIMRGARKAFDIRGQSFSIMDGRFYATYSGHDHMGGRTSSVNGVHHRSGCFQERNPFGEKLDYSTASIGGDILGYPKDGPHTGPLVSINIDLSNITAYANNKLDLDWEEVFQDSILKS